MTTISTLPTAPSRSDPSTFSDRSDALLGALDGFVTETNTVVTEVNALAAAMGSLASGAATAIPYTFSTTTTDSDPGAGILRLDNATQNAATTIRADLVGSDGSTWTDLLATFDDSTSTIKGFIMLQKASDATKWLLFSVSALASPSGYKNITVANVASSAASPFSNGDALLLKFQRNGDKGDTGATGATGAAGTNGTNGTGALITNVTTATTATTLTSTGTLLKITPASYGVAVTLPDATTCSLGGPLHIIDNKGAYPVRVLNSAGTLLGFIFAGVVSHISLIDKSTAAGTWTVENSELVGASAQLLVENTFVLFTSSSAVSVELGAGRELLLASAPSSVSGNLYGVVYDRATNIFGTVTLIRGADIRGNYSLAVVANNSVLVVSCVNNNTALEAVVLSISGTTITVNTAATATLSANISAFADGCGLIAVGSSFVTSYTVATPAAQIRALSISGTTVTIGGATVLDGTTNGLIANAITGVVAASATSGVIYHKYYGISGTTITTGSGGSFGTTSGAVICLAAMTSGRWFLGYSQTSANTSNACFVSLSGTTTSVANQVTVGTGTSALHAFVLSATKVFVSTDLTSSNSNIVTDSSGTASIGTAITTASSSGAIALYLDGNTLYCGGLSSASIVVCMVDCSAASPTLSDSVVIGSNVVMGPLRLASNSVLQRSASLIYGTKFVQALSSTIGLLPGVSSGTAFVKTRLGNNYAGYRGKSDSERWYASSYAIVKTECVA